MTGNRFARFSFQVSSVMAKTRRTQFIRTPAFELIIHRSVGTCCSHHRPVCVLCDHQRFVSDRQQQTCSTSIVTPTLLAHGQRWPHQVRFPWRWSRWQDQFDCELYDQWLPNRVRAHRFRYLFW